MKETRFKSLVDAQFNNGYAQAFIAIVVLSGVLFVFDLLGAWDPAIMRLPLWYAKLIYGIGALSGLVIYGGMFVSWLVFKSRLGSVGDGALLWAIRVEVVGLGFHILSLMTLAVSTAQAGAAAIWILPTSLFLAFPHVQLARALIREWANFHFRQAQYQNALNLLKIGA